MYFHLAQCGLFYACFDETGLGDRSKSWAILNDSDIHRAAQISVLSTAYSRQIMCKYHDGIKIYSSFRILLAFFFTLSH